MIFQPLPFNATYWLAYLLNSAVKFQDNAQTRAVGPSCRKQYNNSRGSPIWPDLALRVSEAAGESAQPTHESRQMVFESTTRLLLKIVQSLANDFDVPWEDDLEFGRQCIYELHQMSRHEDVQSTLVTASNRALSAIPYVKLMNSSIRHRDRVVAIENGRKAIREMTGYTNASVTAL